MVRHSIVGLLMILLLPAAGGLGQQAKLQEPLEFSESSIDLEEAVGSPILPQAADRGPMAGPGLSLTQSQPEPFYNLLSAPEEPQGGAFIRVQSSSPAVGLLIYGRIAIDTVTSNGRLLAPYGYIFLGPRFEESQWTNVISARQSSLGFLFTGPDFGDYRSLARFETYFLSSVVDANVYGLA
jgi:hypothetical protein